MRVAPGQAFFFNFHFFQVREVLCSSLEKLADQVISSGSASEVREAYFDAVAQMSLPEIDRY